MFVHTHVERGAGRKVFQSQVLPRGQKLFRGCLARTARRATTTPQPSMLRMILNSAAGQTTLLLGPLPPAPILRWKNAAHLGQLAALTPAT